MRKNSISKSVDVIRAFTDEQPQWGVNELARFLDVPPSSLHRILKTLREEGILTVDQHSNRYQIGEEMIRLSAIVSSKVGLANIAAKPLKELAEKIGESIYLGVYQSKYLKLSFIDCFHSSGNSVQYVLEIGKLQTITQGASGKVILAHLPKKVMEQVFQKEQVTKEQQDLIWEQIHFLKTKGYLYTENERNVDAFGISAPILSGKQGVVGSISCVIPSKVFDMNFLDEKAEEIKQTAHEISVLLGY